MIAHVDILYSYIEFLLSHGFGSARAFAHECLDIFMNVISKQCCIFICYVLERFNIAFTYLCQHSLFVMAMFLGH